MARKKTNPKIDVNVLVRCAHTEMHKVAYYLFNTESKGVVIPDNMASVNSFKGSGVCFSRLRSEMSGKTYNRILYDMVFDHPVQPILTLAEKHTWIKMCRKNKLLPKYVKYDWVTDENGKLLLDISDISPSLVYAYLSNFRYMRDDPGFVRTMIYLVDRLGMDFYVAYVVAHKACITHSGHSVIEPTVYMEKYSPMTYRYSTSLMVSVYRYFSNPKKYDERTLVGWSETDSYNYIDFACQYKIQNAYTSLLKSTVGHANLFNKRLVDAIRIEENNEEDLKKELEYISKL